MRGIEERVRDYWDSYMARNCEEKYVLKERGFGASIRNHKVVNEAIRKRSNEDSLLSESSRVCDLLITQPHHRKLRSAAHNIG